MKQRHGGNLEFVTISRPSLRADAVIVEVTYAGICGSDLHIIGDHIGLNVELPVVLGHEFVGVVSAVGSDVSGWSVGERVVAETAFEVCGKCLMCRSGKDNACARKQLIGYVHNGAFAEAVMVPASRLHRVPESLSDLDAVLAEPLAGCVHGVIEQAAVKAGDVVTIVGPGTVGLLDAQLAKMSGATVIVAGRSPHRLELARKLGADRVVDLTGADLRQEVLDVTGGLGTDVFIEASGTEYAVQLGLEVTRRRGIFLQQGLMSSFVNCAFDQIAYKELFVVGTMGQNWSAWERALRIAQDPALRLSALISDVFPLSGWRKAFEIVASRVGHKVVFNVGATAKGEVNA